MKFGNEDSKTYEALFGVAGNWNALLRKSNIANKNYEKYKGFIRELLKQNGMADIPVIIKRVYLIDLEGDGRDETFIVASNITKEDYDKISECNFKEAANRYSLLIMSKNIDGAEKNTVVSSCYKDVMEYEVAAFADLDGDRRMEVLVNEENLAAVEAEGFSLSTKYLYEIKNNKLIRVLSVFANPV